MLATLRLFFYLRFPLFLGIELSFFLLLLLSLVSISAFVTHVYFSESNELETERKSYLINVPPGRFRHIVLFLSVPH